MKEEIYSLIDNKQYKELKEFINNLSEANISELIKDLKKEDQFKVFRLINRDKAANVFSYLPKSSQSKIIKELQTDEASKILEEMYTDDAVDILEDLPSNLVIKLLSECNSDTRDNINKLLKYEPDTAGSIMTVEYAELRDDITVKKAISKLKKEIEEYETINTCFVIDSKRKLVGKIFLKELLFAKEDQLIKDIMEKSLSVRTDTDQEYVAKLFKKYDLIVMPVVDNEERLIGIITVDDIIDVIIKENKEDVEKKGGIIPTDGTYLETGVLKTIKKRIPWLLLLMVSATFTSRIISSFEKSLAAIPALTAFIPMLMDTGGNAGGQASVAIINALVLGEIKVRDWYKALWKEARVSIICGMILAVCNFFKLLLIDRVEASIAFCVCLALSITVVVAKFIGCTLPLLAKKVHLDPAVMASPFITTLVDACSLLIYFKIAVTILGV